MLSFLTHIAFLVIYLNVIFMYLKTLKLWNFRCFGSCNQIPNPDNPDFSIDFNSGLNVIVGENDSGKTAVIDAIKLILNTHSSEYIRLDQTDFFENNNFKSNRLRIECIFENLSDDEASHFIEWLSVNDKKSIVLRVILDAQRNNERIFPYDIKAGADSDGHSLDAFAKEFLKTTYLKPLRDAKNELIPRKNSRLSQILGGLNEFKVNPEEHYLVQRVNCIKCELDNYFRQDAISNNDESIRCGKRIKDEIDSVLKVFFGAPREACFSISSKNLKEILELIKLSLDQENLGLGSHNLLFIAAELLNLKKDDWTGLKLCLIEELEAHLHPQAQLRVIEYLQKQAESNIQLILTTHSPNLASKVYLKNIILINSQYPFSFAPDNTMLNNEDYIFLQKFLDVTKSNMFFSKGLIFVEG